MRILIAGFQHETNTFAPSKADWAAFNLGDNFPPYVRGPALLEKFAGGTIPVAGFMEVAREQGWTLVPSAWAGATASAHVTEDAFERISAAILEDLRLARTQGGLSAVYLDLHGGSVAEHLDDPEGELLERVRAIVGPTMPIVASLDLHANVSQRMLAAADALVCYRTYPHIDMAETGKLAANLLLRRLQRGRREQLYVRRVPFLIPLNTQCTMLEPARSIYDLLTELDGDHEGTLSLAMGFPAADVPECGAVVWGYGEDADHNVNSLLDAIVARREGWRPTLLEADAAVDQALALAGGTDGPVVISDTQDNPGAGGDGNTTGMLRALRAAGAGKRHPLQVALGIVWDPRAAAAAHSVGLGARVKLSLGKAVTTYTGKPSDPPVEAEFTVRGLAQGKATIRGPMYTGWQVDLGLSACVELDGILVMVASAKTQLLDRALLQHVGIEPAQMKIIVTKSSVNFRGDFSQITQHVLVARAAGPMSADPADLPWRKLPASIARCP